MRKTINIAASKILKNPEVTRIVTQLKDTARELDQTWFFQFSKKKQLKQKIASLKDDLRHCVAKVSQKSEEK